MGGLFDYIIFKVPLASFYALIAEILAVYLGNGIIVVVPLITSEASWIEFVSGDFFLFGYDFVEEAEKLCDVLCVL